MLKENGEIVLFETIPSCLFKEETEEYLIFKEETRSWTDKERFNYSVQLTIDKHDIFRRTIKILLEHGNDDIEIKRITKYITKDEYEAIMKKYEKIGF